MTDEKKLTDKQIRVYIKNCGVACPYCGNPDTEGDSGEFGENCSQEMRCLACGRRWIDLYTLTGVMEVRS